MKHLFCLVMLLITILAAVQNSDAAITSFTATLSGTSEVPANPSPGTGFVLVAYDDVLHTLNFNVTFSGLSTNVTAAHIHSPAPPTANAGIATTVPTLPGFPSGVTSGNYVNTLTLTDPASFNPAFIVANGGTVAGAEAALAASLAAGTAYFNIHTIVLPGGEIRGQFAAVPGALFVPTILRDSIR